MRRIISTLTLLAMLGSAAAASAETTSVTVERVTTPGSHLVLVDAQTGKVVAEYVAILSTSVPARIGGAPLEPQIRRAFDDVVPLTIQQENAAAERALESQGPPLHTN